MNVPSPLRDVPGLTIGHVTKERARTGCTVIRFEHPVLTAVEVRGAAPGTRELDLLASGRTVQHADAIVLAGGSAFGPAAADGVMRALASDGRGFPTPAGPVPIVPAAVIFDLAEGDSVAPTAEDGETAYRSTAAVPDVAQGRVGAGTGATVSKILGRLRRKPGGLGIAQRLVGEHSVTAIAVLNSFGVPGTTSGPGVDARARQVSVDATGVLFGESTTLVAVVTTMPCDHGALTRACVAAHDGLARTVVPAHTMVDGDVVFASTMSEGAITPRDAMKLTMAVELAVEAAIRSAATVAGDRPANARSENMASP